MVSSPVLLIVFNRPDTTAQVFDALRRVRPKQLFVAGDGPRPNRPEEDERCAETRRVATAVDWPCEVHTLFQDTNLGCGRGVSTAITWFFSQVSAGIVLEDDTVPCPEFFPFCDRLLARYEKDGRVHIITGYNQLPRAAHRQGHFLSRYPSIWGWATWADRWQLYEQSLPNFEVEFAETCARGFIRPWEADHWKERINRSRLGLNDTWDDQWHFTMFKTNARCVRPTVNLVANIGFGHTEAAHHSAVNPAFPQPIIADPRLEELVQPRPVRPLEDKRLFIKEICKRRIGVGDYASWFLPATAHRRLRAIRRHFWPRKKMALLR